MELYEKFDQAVDIEGLKADIKESENGSTREYAEVPLGTYEVAVEKMELGETGPNAKTPGAPMVKIQFRIVSGDFENSCLFMNQVITMGFQFHIMNEFLNSLGSGYTIEFESYKQYSQLIDAVFKAINGRKEYSIVYGQNKGFKTFGVEEIFELE